MMFPPINLHTPSKSFDVLYMGCLHKTMYHYFNMVILPKQFNDCDYLRKKHRQEKQFDK